MQVRDTSFPGRGILPLAPRHHEELRPCKLAPASQAERPTRAPSAKLSDTLPDTSCSSRAAWCSNRRPSASR
jgi:hypothetical protein